MPTAASTTCPSRRRRADRIPSGRATAIAASSDTPVSCRCSRVVRHSEALRPARRASRRRRRPAAGCSHSAAACRSSAPFQLHPGVEGDHRRRVDGPDQPVAAPRTPPGCARPGVQPVHQQRLVVGEVVAVVVQHAQAVGADLGVGGVQVGDVQAALGQRPVGQVVLQAAHVLLGQLVAVAQAGPAVAAADELAGEAEPQLRVARQIGDRPDAQAIGDVGPHAQGVGVVEAQRPEHAQPPVAQRSPSQATGSAPAGGALAAQDLLQQRAGVVGVQIDVPAQQRLPHQPGAAQPPPVLDRAAGGRRQQAGDLAQDHRLGERLAGHPQRAILGGAPRSQAGKPAAPAATPQRLPRLIAAPPAPRDRSAAGPRRSG